MPHALSIDTLGKMLEEGWTLAASCEHDHTCTHIADLDLKALIKRYGADFPLVERRSMVCAALRCTRCGRRSGRLHRAGRSAPAAGPRMASAKGPPRGL